MASVELDDLADSVAIMQACKSRIAELNNVLNEHRAKIEEKMGNADTGTIEGEPVITWKTYKQKRLNQAALALCNPELVESYKDTTEVRRMEIL
jgi:predicted phage-related endonuclease